MYKINKTLSLVLASAIVLSLQSCLVTKKFKKPEVDEQMHLFRLDSLQENKQANIAKISWNTFFKDTYLKQYIDTALVYNQDNAIALKNIAIFKAQLKQGRAGYLPTLNLAGKAQKSTLANAPKSQDFEQFQVSAELSWEADIWGRITSQKLANKAAFTKSVTVQKFTQIQLISNIAIAYYRLLEADKRRAILETTVINRKQGLSTQEALYEAGQSNLLAVNQTKAQLLQAQILLTNVNNEVFSLENALIQLIGKPVAELTRTKLDNQQAYVFDKTGIPMHTLNQRLDVKEAELNYLISFEEHNVALAAMYPSLRLTANFGSQTQDLDKLFSSASLFSNLIGGITQPLFNGRQLRTRKEVTNIQLEQQLLRFKQTVLNAGIEVSNSLLALETTRKNKEVLKAQETLLLQSYNDAKALQAAGMVNYLEVLNAQDNLLNTQLSNAQNQLQYLSNTVLLYKALGGGVIN